MEVEGALPLLERFVRIDARQQLPVQQRRQILQRRLAGEDLRTQHLRGRRLYQVELDVLGAPEGSPVRPRTVDEGTLYATYRQLARFLGAPHRAARYAMECGLVASFESTHQGRPYRYAVLDARMQAWCRHFAAWRPLTPEVLPRVAAPRESQKGWPALEPVPVEEAASAGRLGAFPVRETGEDAHGRPLYDYLTGYDFLTWACSLRPIEERRQILAAAAVAKREAA